MIPTQSDIVLRLAELSRMLDKATQDIADLDEAAVKAKQAHEVASARAYLAADGAVDTRKNIAVVTVAELCLARELAEAQHRACRERIRTIGVQIDVGRTMSAATRNQFAAEATGQWT